jgi:hypothetical protein
MLETSCFFQKTVLEFNMQNTDPSVTPASMSTDAVQMLEVQWFDIGNGTWTTIRGTFTTIANMGKMRGLNDLCMFYTSLVMCLRGDCYGSRLGYLIHSGIVPSYRQWQFPSKSLPQYLVKSQIIQCCIKYAVEVDLLNELKASCYNIIWNLYGKSSNVVICCLLTNL